MAKRTKPQFFFSSPPCGLWDLSSLTGDRTWALGSERAKSQPLDRQGIPYFLSSSSSISNLTVQHLSHFCSSGPIYFNHLGGLVCCFLHVGWPPLCNILEKLLEILEGPSHMPLSPRSLPCPQKPEVISPSPSPHQGHMSLDTHLSLLLSSCFPKT